MICENGMMKNIRKENTASGSLPGFCITDKSSKQPEQRLSFLLAFARCNLFNDISSASAIFFCGIDGGHSPASIIFADHDLRKTLLSTDCAWLKSFWPI
jgi:hypothetical protein